ncbi:hypothetical protein PV328_006741 [Microctonus aethiopoides]|uniref:DNA polymerase eta n=1 Tax=Microctonus aethiopoides TaxID=144406 RepID=A0AA39FPR1_9HYME|nr:hypothetical protein PV328_006741 [Microctonus aethiopoides]
MTNFGNRIVVLIDMDCFFCQVEAKLNPILKGKAMAVVQYSTFGPGATIAVSYEARAFGVTKHMRRDEARKKCPHIELVTVPPIRNKPDTSRYRNAGKQVIEVLAKYCNVVERASVDEAYLDITDLVESKLEKMSYASLDEIKKGLSSSFVVGHCDNDSNDEEKRREGIDRWVDEAFDDTGDIQSRKLAIAGIIVEEFREAIYSQCEYRCSAGISYNKILAKLACGLHKPNRQTILPIAEVSKLYSSLPINKVRNLGGKFGNIIMESLGCNVMADLLRFSLQDLQKRFDEKTGSWLYNIARGIDNEPVQARLVGKSIGSTKNFPGKQAITKLETLKYWVGELTTELVERLEQDLEENQRRATSITISYHFVQDKRVIAQSRVCSLSSYKHDKIANICLNVITRATQKPIAYLGMSASKFVPAEGTEAFVNFFKAGTSKNDNTQNKTVTKSLKAPESQIKNVTDCENNPDQETKKSEEENVKACNEKKQIMEDIHVKLNENSIESSVVMTTKESSLISNTDLKKTFNGENLKNSFFMNFLKGSTSSLEVNESKKKSAIEEKKESIEKYVGKIDDCTPDNVENCSPDLFDDLTSQECAKEDKKVEQNVENDRDHTITSVKRSALLQLQEIFPDLDNIDLSVVQLLPIELQREAHAYLKSKKPVETIGKIKSTTKPSSNKSKPAKTTKLKSKNSIKTSNSTINNFFIKSSTDSNDLSSMKRCPQCNQMIKIEKLDEHSDFHVAKNLHKIINQSSTNEMRNQNDISNSNVTTKRKSSPKTQESNKKFRIVE